MNDQCSIKDEAPWSNCPNPDATTEDGVPCCFRGGNLKCIGGSGDNRCGSCQRGPSSNDCCILEGVNSGLGCPDGSYCCNTENNGAFECRIDGVDCPTNN